MSKIPFRPCRKPGCSKLSKDGSGWCADHKNYEQKQADARRNTAVERGYDWRWQKIRNWKLKVNPICERCEEPKPAVLVHHKDKNPKNNEFSNLMALCLECHQQEHKEDVFVNKSFRG